MPRKSSASSDVLQITRPIQRPTPPSDLTPKQAAQWNKYVDCFPVEYFDPPAQILLKELCRAVDFLRSLCGVAQRSSDRNAAAEGLAPASKDDGGVFES